MLLREPHYPLGAVMLRDRTLLTPLGLVDPIDQKLGKGSFGAAYGAEVPRWGKSVLKFTRDPTEAQAAALLQGKDTERIVRIHGIWAMQGSHEGGLRGWYLVHREYLAPLKKRDAMLVEAIWRIYDDTTLDLVIPRRRHRAMIGKWRNYLREELYGQDIHAEEGAALPLRGVTDLKRAEVLLTTIGDAVQEMHRHGIDWEDIHSGNLMINGRGRMVIADVGWGLMHNDFDQVIPYLTETTVSVHLKTSTSEPRPVEEQQPSRA